MNLLSTISGLRLTAGKIPAKFFKEETAKLKALLKKEVDKDFNYAVINDTIALKFWAKDLHTSLTNFGGHQFAERSIKARIEGLEEQIDSLVKHWREFAANTELVDYLVDRDKLSDDEKVLYEIRSDITHTLQEMCQKKHPTVAHLFKDFWVVDKQDLLDLANEFAQKAKAVDREGLIKGPETFRSHDLEKKYNFLKRMKLTARLKDLVAVKDAPVWNIVSWLEALQRVLESLYSEKAEDLQATQFDLYGLKVIVQDSELEQDDIRAYIKYLRQAYALLSQKGYKKVWHGVVYINCKSCGGVNPHTKGGVGGHYNIGEDHIKIFERPGKFIVELMAHELGHRWWFKGMTQGQRLKFRSLIKTKVTPHDDENPSVAPVSDYGASNIDEAFAEVFMHFVMGRDMNRDQIESFKAVTASVPVVNVRLASVAMDLMPINLELAFAILKTAGDEVPEEYKEVLNSVRRIHTKYLTWSLKQLKAGANPEELLQVIEFFHKNNQRFKVKDIGAYKTLKDLEEVAKAMPSESKSKQKEKAKVEGATKLFEDERFLMLHIKTKKASVCYGSGTQWCITMEEESYFESYSFQNVVFYFVVDKSLPPENPLHKVAFAIYRDEETNNPGDREIFDAEDNKISCPEYMMNLLKLMYADAPKHPTVDPLQYINSKNDGLRAAVAARIDPKHLPKMVNDPDIDVRLKVAFRLNPEDLHLMVKDPSASVRETVVERLSTKELPLMMDDKDRNIRAEVASRIDIAYLPKMMDDKDGIVRLSVSRRIDPEYLPKMMKDESPYVRSKVVDRIDPKYLPEIVENDPSKNIRGAAQDRLYEIEHEKKQKEREGSVARIAGVVDRLLPLNIKLALTVLRAAEPVPPEYEEVLNSVRKIHTKYLTWALKQLKAGADPEAMLQTLEFFHKHGQRFKVKDIGAYKTLNALIEAAKAVPAESKSKTKEKAKVEGADKLFEDERFLLLSIRTKKASVCYGAGTQWCITMKNESYFEKYSIQNVVFYFVIDKTLPPDNPLHKVAFAIYRDGKNNPTQEEIFDAEDAPIGCPQHMQSLLQLAYKDAPRHKNVSIVDYVHSEDTDIRETVALQIDPEHLPLMAKDPSAEIRARVAYRMNPEDLHLMVNDEEHYVRQTVVERLLPKDLHLMMKDPSGSIRAEVASRIDKEHLLKMMDDEDGMVKRYVAHRIDPEHLHKMMNDESPYVRGIVVERIEPKYLPEMAKDSHKMVRDKATRRLHEIEHEKLQKEREGAVARIATGLEVLAAFEGISLVNFGRTDQIRYIMALKNNQVVAGVQVSLVKPGWYEVTKIYAPTARLGYLMFITALYEFEQLVPDTVLSNASKAIISRWYDKYQGTEYVVEDVRGYGKPGPYYAGYKCPPEVIGQLPVKTIPYNQKWADDFNKSFGEAYSGPPSKNYDKSKTLDLLLKGHQIDKLLDEIVDSNSDIPADIRDTWVKKNRPALLKLLETLEGRDREQLQQKIEHV